MTSSMLFDDTLFKKGFSLEGRFTIGFIADANWISNIIFNNSKLHYMEVYSMQYKSHEKSLNCFYIVIYYLCTQNSIICVCYKYKLYIYIGTYYIFDKYWNSHLILNNLHYYVLTMRR